MIKIPKIFPEIEINTKISLMIIFSFATAILTYLSIFGAAGRFGDIVGTFLGLLLGRGSGFLPLAFVLFGILLMRVQQNKDLSQDVNARLVWGISIGFLAFNGLLNIIFRVDTINEVPNGGGVVGFFVYPRILGNFGIIGGLFIILSMFLTSFFLISQMTFARFVEIIEDGFKDPAKFWDLIPDIFELWKPASKSESTVSDESKFTDNSSFVQNGVTDVQVSPTAQSNTQDSSTHNFDINTKNAQKNPKKAKFRATGLSDGIIDLQEFSFANGSWENPNIQILREGRFAANPGNIEKNKQIIQQTLSHFGISVEMKDVRVGPTVTQYSLKPANGVKLSAIDNLQRDLGLALATANIRIEAPINGQSLVGIEIPNVQKAEVRLRTLFESDDFRSTSSLLPIAVGQDVAGNNLIASLSKMPHLLVAGATGSGKSVWINSLLMSLLYRYSPKDLQVILVDMKRVELKLYEGVPHLMCPVITEADKAINALKWTVIEMDKRYKVLEEHGKRNIQDYNQFAITKDLEKLPYLVFIIDELGDLMMLAKSEVEPIIVRLTQMSRAVGIHLVLGTQRPDIHVVTGLIKANVPSRIAFAVASQIDSRVILDYVGAEKLLGQGDGLFMSPSSIAPVRFQGPNVDEKEVRQVVTYLKEEGKRQGYDNFNTSVTEIPKVKIQVPGMVSSNSDDDSDDKLEEARRLVISHQKASASFLQQMMGIGYPKAARIIQHLEEMGVVGPQNGSKPRDVYLTEE
jgi:S-DNA-T family DNA segregation ATPase FtsK/SpoIIIE